jgi:hypothetical protein
MTMTVAETTDWKRSRGRVAALSRSRSSDDPDLIQARRDLKADRLEEYIRVTVEAAPPLTTDQRERLSAILRGGANDAA